MMILEAVVTEAGNEGFSSHRPKEITSGSRWCQFQDLINHAGSPLQASPSESTSLTQRISP